MVAILLSGCGESIGESAGKAIADNINQQLDFNQTLHSNAFQYIDQNGQVHTVQLGEKVAVNYNDSNTNNNQNSALDQKILILEQELNKYKNDQIAKEALQKKIDELETKIQELQVSQQHQDEYSTKETDPYIAKTDFDMSWDYNSNKIIRSDLSKLTVMMPQAKYADASDRRKILQTIDKVFSVTNPVTPVEIKRHTGKDGIQTVIRRYDINEIFKLHLDHSFTQTLSEKYKYIIDMRNSNTYDLYLANNTGWSGTWTDYTKTNSPLNFTFITPDQTDAGDYATYDLKAHRFKSDIANEKFWKVVSFQFMIPHNNFQGTVGYADPKNYTDILVFDVLYFRDRKYDWEYRAGILSSTGKKNTPRGIEFYPHVLQFD